MSCVPDADVARQLTGLCTFLVQGPPFEAGDEVDLVFARETTADGGEEAWLPINVTRPSKTRDALNGGERDWGRQVVLVRARLSRTGGVPRDSMNRPSDDYDPDALSLSDVRVLDRSPPAEGSAASDESGSDRS